MLTHAARSRSTVSGSSRDAVLLEAESRIVLAGGSVAEVLVFDLAA